MPNIEGNPNDQARRQRRSLLFRQLPDHSDVVIVLIAFQSDPI
jgi:hypothetical protein